MKRILCLLLVLFLTAAPLCAAAAGGEYLYTGSLKQFDSPSLAPADSAVDTIYQGLLVHEERIDLKKYALTKDELSAAFQAVKNTAPELFYVDLGYEYYITGGKVSTLIPHYLYDADTCAQMSAELNERLDLIAAQAQSTWTDFEKALFVHDYLCANFRYDTSVFTDPNQGIYDVYNFIMQGKGVCQAYTLTAIALLERLGVAADAAYSEKDNHTWNLVKVDGVWYHMDVTWDDPVPDVFGLARHNNFLLSDAGITATKHREILHLNVSAACTDTRYETGFWTEVISPFAYLDGSWYCIAPAVAPSCLHAIFETDFSDLSMILPLPELWPVANMPGYIYNDYYSGLFSYQGNLWYNTPNAIIRFDPFTENNPIKTVFSFDAEDEWIYGVRLNESGVCYALESDPKTDAYTVYLLELPCEILYGDTDGDGIIDIGDIAWLAKYVAGWNMGDSFLIENADCNGDSIIDIGDVMQLAKFVAGWEVSLGSQN